MSCRRHVSSGLSLSSAFWLVQAHAWINAEINVDLRIVRFAYRSSLLRRGMAVPDTDRSAHGGKALFSRGVPSLTSARDTTSAASGHSHPLPAWLSAASSCAKTEGAQLVEGSAQREPESHVLCFDDSLSYLPKTGQNVSCVGRGSMRFACCAKGRSVLRLYKASVSSLWLNR